MGRKGSIGRRRLRAIVAHWGDERRLLSMRRTSSRRRSTSRYQPRATAPRVGDSDDVREGAARAGRARAHRRYDALPRAAPKRPPRRRRDSTATTRAAKARARRPEPARGARGGRRASRAVREPASPRSPARTHRGDAPPPVSVESLKPDLPDESGRVGNASRRARGWCPPPRRTG